MSKPMTSAEKKLQFTVQCWEVCTIPATFEVEEPVELMVEMSDGVRLRTVYYRPKTEGKKVPLVFVRSCYPAKEDTYRLNAREFCKRGIAFLYQFCRGRGGSEGEWKPRTMYERTDGVETIRFIESLDWVGPVGYWGNSYLSMCGWVLMEGLSDRVKTMYLTNQGTDRYLSSFESGLLKQDLHTGWARENNDITAPAGHLESCLYRPHISVDTDLWGKQLDWYREFISSDQPDAEYWNRGLSKVMKEAPSHVKIPIYVGSSWFDIHHAGSEKAWATMAEEGHSQSVFCVGAWEHSFYSAMRGHPLEHMENNDNERALRWFLDILVEEKKPKAGARLYIIGADEWHTYDRYPVPAEERVLYLSAEPSSPEAGSLKEACDALVTEKSYMYDPENYVPSCGGEKLFSLRDQRGSVLQPPCGYRPDVLSFRSEIIDRDVTIAGSIRGKLMVKSTAEDTAFTIKVMEEFPDGSTYNLRSGIATLAFRNGMEKREEYTPDTWVELEIPTWNIAWKPAIGSRIRIDISSSDFPQYAIHSNYPGPFAEQTVTCTAEQTILLGGENSSYIILPVLSD